MCPEFGLFLVLVAVVFYFYMRELKMKNTMELLGTAAISQVKIAQEIIVADTEIKIMCMDFLSAEFDCLIEMADYIGKLSAQVLVEPAQSKENSVVECFLSCERESITETILEDENTIKIEQFKEFEIIREVISDEMKEETPEDLQKEVEKASEIETEQLMMPEEVTGEVIPMQISEVVKQENLACTSEDVRVKKFAALGL
jgi:hypothetical protein